MPAVGGPRDLDALLYPPPALPHEPGRLREYTSRATDREVEIAPGVFFPGWTYNGTIPGPVIRATEDELLRVRFVNAGARSCTPQVCWPADPGLRIEEQERCPGHCSD